MPRKITKLAYNLDSSDYVCLFVSKQDNRADLMSKQVRNITGEHQFSVVFFLL